MRRLAQRTGARVQRQLGRRSSTRVGVILVFHEIGTRQGDPRTQLVPALAVDVFEALLDHLVDNYEVVPVAQVQPLLASSSAGDRVPVALTFDDDLSAHVEHAAPALARRDLPATFYVTGRTLTGPEPFWWQDLQAVADGGRLEGARERLATIQPALRATEGLHALALAIERLPPRDRDAVQDELRALAADGSGRERGLPAAGVGPLARAFDIGFHTRAHDSLPQLGDDELARALEEGRADLDAVCGRRLTSIAYPFGHADARVARAAAAAGYERGLTWCGGTVEHGTPALLLDRADGWAASVEAFAWRLSRVVARGTRGSTRARGDPATTFAAHDR